MKKILRLERRAALLVVAVLALTVASTQMRADTGTCSGQSITLPFTDVTAGNIFFCSIAQAYFTGLTNGTTATTYSPSDPVPREQMAAFITRTQDSVLKRGSRRAALKQWWTPTTAGALRSIDLANDAAYVTGLVSDGTDLWVCLLFGDVKRVRASDGKVLQTWGGAVGTQGIIFAAGRVFLTGIPGSGPGKIYVIDPTATPGAVSVFEDSIGQVPFQITFDGTSLWTANESSISRVDITTGIDSTFSAGFAGPKDILWDGANLWVLDATDSRLKRVNPSNGAVLESTQVIPSPQAMTFDGTNVWVCGVGSSNNVSIVRAAGSFRGTVLATLSAGQGPTGIAFDGERILVCNYPSDSVSLFKAADFTLIATVPTGFQNGPYKVCSDGLSFWIGIGGNPARLFRF
jgi:DNA-binding beta-propeller fold protein YncE